MSDALDTLTKQIDRSPAEDMSFEEMVASQGYSIPGNEKVEAVQFKPEDVQKAQKPPSAEAGSEGGTNLGKDVSEVVKGAAKAVPDIIQGIYNFGVDVADGVENFAAEMGMGSGDIINENSKLNWTEKLTGPEDSSIQRITRGIVRYGTPVAATMGVGAGPLAAMATGAGIDAMILDPHQERISSLILDEAPELKNLAVVGNTLEFLKNKPGEGSLEGRFKNVVEGALIGLGVTTGAKGLAKIFSGGQIMSKEAKAYMDSQKMVKILPEAELAAAEVKAGSNAIPAEELQGDLFKYAETLVEKEGGGVRPNLNNQNVLDYLSQFAKENPQGVTAREAGGVADAAVDSFLRDPAKLDSLLKWKAGDRPLTDIEVKATHQLMNTAYESVLDAAQKAIAGGDDSALAHFSNTLDVYKYVDNVRAGAGSAAGAALNAHKIAEDVSQMPFDEYMQAIGQIGKNKMLSDMVKLGGGKENLSELAKRVKAIEETGLPVDSALSDIAKGGTIKKSLDIAQGIAINGMLSSPKTVAANMISNAYTTGNNVATNATAWAIGHLRGTPDAITLSQQAGFIRGAMGSIMEGISAAGNALRGRQTSPASKAIKLEFQRPNPMSIDIPEEASLGYKIWGNIVNKFGMLMSIPTKVNSTADAFFSTINYRGSIYEQAIAQAESTGLKGEEYRNFVQNKITSPTVAMHENAIGHAKETTFSRALNPNSQFWLERQASKIDAVIDEFPLGRVVLPFFKTSANILDYTINHSPLAVLSPPIARQIMAGGKQGDVALARAVNGSMFLGLSAYLASEGVITGPAPANFKIRQAIEESNTGWQPDSIKVGDTYVSVNRIDPMSSVMRLGAVLANLRTYVEAAEFEQLAAISGAAVADFLTPEMMVDSFSRTMGAYNQASKYSSDKGKVIAAMSNFVGRFTPYGALQRDLKNIEDPFKGSTDIVSKDAGFLDAFTDQVMAHYKAISPWLSEDLPIQRNMFGEPLMVPSGLGPDMISPFAESKGENSRLVQQLQSLSKYFSEFSPTNSDLVPLTLDLPGKNITFKGVEVELTPAEHERLIMYSAGLDPQTGKAPAGSSLREVLGQVVEPIWKEMGSRQMSPKEYNKLVGTISSVIRKYREIGKAQMISDPAFLDRWNKKLNRMLETQDVTPNSQLGL